MTDQDHIDRINALTRNACARHWQEFSGQYYDIRARTAWTQACHTRPVVN